jgi:hypothetical protein
LADELSADGSQGSNESPASEGAAAAEASGTLDANDAAGVGDAVEGGDALEATGSTEASDSAEEERVAGEAVDGDIPAAVAGDAAAGDAAAVVKKTPVFNRLPLDVYLDWLASNLVGLSSDDPELETPALRLPKQLPAAWLRYGLSAANWKEAVRTISRRFRWLERTASAMRRDCRRFVADSGPPPG